MKGQYTQKFLKKVVTRTIPWDKPLLMIGAFVFPIAVCMGGAGELEPTFGDGGKVTTSFFSSQRDYGWDHLVVQDDDKILIAGSRGIVRFLPNGLPGEIFGESSIVTPVFADIRSVAIQSDGNFGVARYNTTGSLDGSFGSGGVVLTDFDAEDRAASVVIQDNQNLVVAGGTRDDFALARYLPDGSLDTSYGSGGMVTTDFGKGGSIQTIAVQPDGQIVAAGLTRNPGFPDETRSALARYTVSGALDTTFDSDGKVIPDLGEISASQDIVLQPDGKILVAVSHEKDFASIRMLSDGSLDATYGENGLAGRSVE